jgi:hypothetical protein
VGSVYVRGEERNRKIRELRKRRVGYGSVLHHHRRVQTGYVGGTC